jgi:hypothetical protein
MHPDGIGDDADQSGCDGGLHLLSRAVLRREYPSCA